MSKQEFTLNPVVSKYMDETGTSLEEAANELALNWDEVWDETENEDED